MRDVLPEATEALGALTGGLLATFGGHGYRQVTTPAFEYAEVLERGMSSIDRAEQLRFFEPGTGELALLRPDMTPQIARIVATRLAHLPAMSAPTRRVSSLERAGGSSRSAAAKRSSQSRP